MENRVIKCDLCDAPAVYDGQTVLRGQWAYMCEAHFSRIGVGLGLGRGQVLTKPKLPKEKI